jgi:hypothetical protein
MKSEMKNMIAAVAIVERFLLQKFLLVSKLPAVARERNKTRNWSFNYTIPHSLLNKSLHSTPPLISVLLQIRIPSPQPTNLMNETRKSKSINYRSSSFTFHHSLQLQAEIPLMSKGFTTQRFLFRFPKHH